MYLFTIEHSQLVKNALLIINSDHIQHIYWLMLWSRVNMEWTAWLAVSTSSTLSLSFHCPSSCLHNIYVCLLNIPGCILRYRAYFLNVSGYKTIIFLMHDYIQSNMTLIKMTRSSKINYACPNKSFQLDIQQNLF